MAEMLLLPQWAESRGRYLPIGALDAVLLRYSYKTIEYQIAAFMLLDKNFREMCYEAGTATRRIVEAIVGPPTEDYTEEHFWNITNDLASNLYRAGNRRAS